VYLVYIELWQKTGEHPSVFAQKWPAYDANALQRDTITWVIQINGKIRERVEGSVDMDQKTAQEFALNTPRISGLLEGKQIRKVIVVPRKLINIVAN